MRLIAMRLRAGIALLSAGVIGTALPLFAVCTEAAGQAPEPPAATRSATHQEKAGRPSKVDAVDGRELRLQKKQLWWNHARELLLSNIEISAEQARGVDAILGEQLDKRAQHQRHDVELKAARRSGDPERIDAALTAVFAIRAQIKEPHEIYEEIRALLSEEQRPQFDMNRARHVAESQAPAKERAAPNERGDRATSKAW